MEESGSASAKATAEAEVNGQPETEQNPLDASASSAEAPYESTSQPPQHHITQVREFREPPSATSAASDQNSTPTRSPSRSTAAGRTHAQYHHHRQHQQRQHRRTVSPTTPTPIPLQQPTTSRSNNHTSSVKVAKVTADDVALDDVTTGGSAGLARVHRRIAGGGIAQLPLAPQSLSDPTASPSLSMRHHNVSKLAAAAAGAAGKSSAAANDVSPAHRKRSKSESRRRRERKQIAAGELEVRQANETLMRYLRQCTEINDASLSGELEIDQTYDDRRVHRKTRSQRERRGFQSSAAATIGPSASAAAAALVAAGGAGAGGTGGVAGARGRLQLQNGLTNILNSLAEDIRPATGGSGATEIYNPFTPVVSPSEGAPHHMGIGSKMFVQHPHRYRRDGSGDGVDGLHGVEDGFRADLEHGIEHNRYVCKVNIYLS